MLDSIKRINDCRIRQPGFEVRDLPVLNHCFIRKQSGKWIILDPSSKHSRAETFISFSGSDRRHGIFPKWGRE